MKRPGWRLVYGRVPWAWPLAGVVAIILATTAVSGRGPVPDLQSALQQGAVVVILGLGQLFLITAGNGNVDLSMPGIITLAGFAGIGTAADTHSNFLGLLAAIGVGLGSGLVNIVLILVVAIPPIVGTLATGLLLDSVVLEVGASGPNTPGSLSQFSVERMAGIPVVALVALGVTLVAALVLHKTAFGRSVAAIGQSRKAALRSGLLVNSVVAGCYLISGSCAGVAGLLLSAMTGASIGIGDPYLLVSVAVVVLGGSRIRGGRSNVTGVWVGAVLLNVLLTLFYALHLSAAYQDIAEGCVIVGVLAGAADKLGATQ